LTSDDTRLSAADRLLLDARRLGRRVRARLAAVVRAGGSDERATLAIGRFGPFELAYRRGTVDERVIRETIDGDAFFGSVPEYRAEPGHVILDVGAHIGAFALDASRRVSAGRVLAVEASLESFNYLRVNRALNGAANLEIDHLALAARQGTATLYHDVGNWGHSIVKKLSSRTEPVATETLAGYLDARGVARCDFAKLNCEGAEFPILLASSAATLGKIDRLLVLYHLDLVTGSRLEDLERHLQDAGFRLRRFDQARGRGWIYAAR